MTKEEIKKAILKLEDDLIIMKGQISGLNYNIEENYGKNKNKELKEEILNLKKENALLNLKNLLKYKNKTTDIVNKISYYESILLDKF